MATGNPRKRPMRFLRRDSASSLVAIAGTVDSFVAPSYGWEVVTLFADLAQAGTVAVYQRLRGSSSWALTDQYVFAAAGILRDTIQVTGEQVRVLFTNGGVAQRPEMIFGLA